MQHVYSPTAGICGISWGVGDSIPGPFLKPSSSHPVCSQTYPEPHAKVKGPLLHPLYFRNNIRAIS